MNYRQKTKTIKRSKLTKKRSLPKTIGLKLVHKNHKLLKYFRLIEHRHTGKMVHHKHTSHATLFVLLFAVGIVLFSNQAFVNAWQATSSGVVSVGALVKGAPPSVGATITNPVDGANIVDDNEVEITGVCSENTLVVITNNGVSAGSTVCTSAGIFSLDIQLMLGINVISALNYDNYNQAGPATPSITIHMSKTQEKVDETQPVVPENLPANPSIVDGADTNQIDTTCENFDLDGDLPSSDEPHASIVCMPRLFLPGIQQTLGYIVWGGTPPYAISIDWGNSLDPELVSVTAPGYKTKKFTYASAGIFKINLKLKDKNENSAFVQASVQVSGDSKSTITGNDVNTDTDNTNTSTNKPIDDNTPWFIAPVPLYLVAVAITLGFWIGDIFDRYFGSNVKTAIKKRKSA